jgi:NAD(P)-dependent dehydrogenase (short-subunit alcohol dehydrogenase family)
VYHDRHGFPKRWHRVAQWVTVSIARLSAPRWSSVPKDVLDANSPSDPAQPPGKAREIAGLIVYLCSDEAVFVTGANIAVNGGQQIARSSAKDGKLKR